MKKILNGESYQTPGTIEDLSILKDFEDISIDKEFNKVVIKPDQRYKPN